MKKLLNNYPIQVFFLSIIIVFIISFIYLSFYNSKYIINKNIKDINLFNVDNLIIIAHPSDEILYNSNNLIKDNYLVVCISCGSKNEETHEFVKVLSNTNDKYIMLGYPEYQDNTRINWNNYYNKLSNTLKDIIDSKNWNMIVTHNPEGEYGNIQHKLISNIVIKLTINKDKLYYFNKYYSKQNISNYQDSLIKLDRDVLKTKIELLNTYDSLHYLESSFSHSLIYEELIPHRKWGIVYEEIK